MSDGEDWLNVKVLRHRQNWTGNARNHPGPYPNFHCVTLCQHAIGIAHGVRIGIAGNLTQLENLHILIEQMKPVT